MKILIWILLALLQVMESAAASPPLAGRPLLEALSQLQQDGLRIVYSSAVVTPAMVVEVEPEGDQPRDILEQILAPHGLMAYDDLGFYQVADDETQDVLAEYGSFSAWLNMQTQWSPHFFSQTIVSVGRLTRRRTSTVDEELFLRVQNVVRNSTTSASLTGIFVRTIF